MNVVSKKLGFWAVFGLVTGSQIGSGVFMSPATLAPYGLWSVFGYLFSGFGAIALGYVFARLCARFPQTGGPHVYVAHTFGKMPAFFTGWTYWVISWVSSTTLVVTSVGYLAPFFPPVEGWVYLAVEFSLLLMVTLLNLKGVRVAGRAEFFLTLLKFVPLIILPLCAFCFFDANNFMVAPSVADISTPHMLGQVTLLTLWGFIGLESATTPAGAVENPGKTIPRAIVLGTLSVALLYLLNGIGVMGMIPGDVLAASPAPYVELTQRLFGGNWHLLISLVAAVVCLGTLNAWILTSGQIALGLAQEGLLPHFFARKTVGDAPLWGVVVSAAGILPLLILTADTTLARQVTTIIDISVISFLFVYLICCASYVTWLIRDKANASLIQWVAGLVALAFSLWILYETPLSTLVSAAGFVVSGLPVYFFWWKRRKV